MTHTTSPAPLVAHQTHRREIARLPIARQGHAGHEDSGGQTPSRRQKVLGRYLDRAGRPREVITEHGYGGSVLVIDRAAGTFGDRRLVAHLAADEPAANAALVCSDYLAQLRRGAYRCRCVTPDDFRLMPFATEEHVEPLDAPAAEGLDLIDARGVCYRLELVQTGMTIPELRWRGRSADKAHAERHTLSVRGVIARLERYEPVRVLTARALAAQRGCAEVSTSVLRGELQRVLESPIVLNRGLRMATLAAVECHGLSMSEIAIRCGRIKRDPKGKESGETSWLARRLGLLPEGGRDTPTPWVHTDVLALIARRGLGISPREVELG